MKTGILGYGKMAKGIYGLLSESHEVTVYVRRPDVADKANDQVEKRIQRALRKGEITETGAAARRQALRFSTDIGELAGCELVIESISEDPAAKAALLSRVEAAVSETCLITTNTSALSIAELARGLERPERFAGLHFFHPIPLSAIVEVLSWHGMAPATGEALSAFVSGLGKRPLPFREGPGSVLNTILSPYYLEGIYLLEQGAALPSEVDQIAGTFCRIGPIESVDSIGLSFLVEAHRRLMPVLPEALALPTLPERLVAMGRGGQHEGAGFYRYTPDGPCDEAPEFYAVTGQSHSARTAEGCTDEAIRLRLEYAVLCGALCNAARGVGALDDLDFGIAEILAMDEGPVARVRRTGIDTARREMSALQQSVGARFDPALLDTMTE